MRYGTCTIGPLCLLVVAGCAHFWDEITSSERDWAYITGINKPNPLKVIQDNDYKVAGAKHQRRAQALSELREPLQHGGNAKDQDVYLEILTTTAKEDPEPYCRLTAIRALGRFRDPRAARALEDIHQLKKSPLLPDFTPEINHMLRKEALVALEMTKDPDAWKLFCVIAGSPGPSPKADMMDRQQTQDEKIVAIRALKNYRQKECIETLQTVLQSEKDIALRDRALQSLEESTGRRWPREYAAWQQEEVRPLPPDPSGDFIRTVSGWIPKW